MHEPESEMYSYPSFYSFTIQHELSSPILRAHVYAAAVAVAELRIRMTSQQVRTAP